MKFVKNLAFSLGLLFITGSLLFTGVNAFDEDVSPEAKALIAHQPQITEEGKRAFFYLLGLRAGDHTHPLERGRELWEQGLALPVDQESKFFSSRLMESGWSCPFYFSRDKALSQQWRESEAAHKELQSGRQSLDEYLQWIQMGDYAYLRARHSYSPSAGGQTMRLAGHRWFSIYMAKLAAEEKWSEMEKWIQIDARFQKHFLHESSLLAVMISLMIVNDDARVLDLEKQIHPNLKVSKQTLQALELPSTQEMRQAALEQELRLYADSIKNVGGGGFLAEVVGPERQALLRSIPQRPFLLVGAATNRYLDYVRAAEVDGCANQGCAEALAWGRPHRPWRWVRNPAGRIVFEMFTFSMDSTFRKMRERREKHDEILKRLAIG